MAAAYISKLNAHLHSAIEGLNSVILFPSKRPPSQFRTKSPSPIRIHFLGIPTFITDELSEAESYFGGVQGLAYIRII
jgi:hypothetical protein